MSSDSFSPNWMANLTVAAQSHAHVLLTGNVRDQHLLGQQLGELKHEGTAKCVWEALGPGAYEFLLTYDPTNGLAVLGAEWETVHSRLAPVFEDEAVGELEEGSELSLDQLADLIVAVAVDADAVRAGVLLERASRLVIDPTQVQPAEHQFFCACERLSLDARRHRYAGEAWFNPVVWLVDSARDLPDWFVLARDSVTSIAVPPPSFEHRLATVSTLGPNFNGYSRTPEAERKGVFEQFATLTEGMSLRSVLTIAELAQTHEVEFSDLPETVRWYRMGIEDSPWRKSYIFRKIRTADKAITTVVLGQDRAVGKSLDILKRGVTGLSGAQAGSSSDRPRGVLFFAGPTGVGKTELAKQITQALFGSPDAYIRFDMSEYSAEHAEARLIGAPPGYVGYEAGGQLTDAIRQRPFSVVLFDEIEKAHDRLMDKFLQILEDGRLTDGRGETVYFSEAIIIFTSNLGIVAEDQRGEVRQLISAQERLDGLSYADVEQRVRQAIEEHFRYKLKRPELLNRLGDNIVVFDFIMPETARAIFDKMLSNVERRLQEEQYISSVRFEPRLKEALRDACIADLDHGGRGIGNRLETYLVNPLARALFELLDIDEESRGGEISDVQDRSLRISALELDTEPPDIKVEIQV